MVSHISPSQHRTGVQKGPPLTHSCRFHGSMNASQWKLFLGSQQSFVWDVHRAVHQETAVNLEGSSLLRLGKYINPHFFGRFVRNHNFSFRHLVSHEEVFVLDVLGSLTTGASPVYF